ncbi:DUF1287 domain-containing protein [Hyphomonas sp.]|uniref:DUF1287 domain-containing protein n=1 Tax=Hyphomonas sp. TaxID=87 RepID=UPI000B0761F5|nr:DUF1287 domain-containing protein [Hyphomonas sp.]
MWTRRSFLVSALGLPLLPPLPLVEAENVWTKKLVRAARKQIGVTTGYDPAYVTLAYPGGDIPRETGVCTDVVIRAYRDAFDVDLQVLVHDDMTAAFGSYPRSWGLTRADRNIDHRRVPNLERYFQRQGLERDAPGTRDDWQAGDLITMRLGGRLPHIAIFSGYDPLTGNAMFIHNIGGGTREDELYADYDTPRRFRFAPPAV